MDHTNAKQVTKALLATCFVFVIIAGGAFALSMILSNTLHDETIATDDPLVLTETNGLPGNTAVGVAYYLNGTVGANVDCQGAYVTLDISRAGFIAGANVTVLYAINGGEYLSLTMSPVDVDTMTGTVETGLDLLAGESFTISFQVTFNDAGSYTTDYTAGASA